MKEIECNDFCAFEVESWCDFDDFSLKSPQCVFRGQGNAKWELVTAYERIQRVQNPMREPEMLRKFISQAGIYEKNLPDRHDFVSWLSLMQHYGAGTRLLDVTRSKYIALFFALTGMASGRYTECAVWAFETCCSNRKFYNTLLKSEETGCVDIRPDPLATPLIEYNELGWKFANKFIVSDWEGGISGFRIDKFVEKYKTKMECFYKNGCVIEVVPQISNKRMIAQSAEFLMPVTLRESFMTNLLKAKDGCSPQVNKLVIPMKFHNEFMMKLKEMNITYQSLFPDLSGLARNVN